MAAADIRRRLTYGPSRRGERTFRVTDVTTPEAAQNHPDVPDYLDGFPGSPVLRATEFDTEQVSGSKGDAWDVTIRYEPNRLQQGDPGDDPDPDAIGYTEFNVSIQARPYDTYQVGPFTKAPEQYHTSGYSAGDIGGTSVDSAGEPTTITAVLPVIKVSHTISGSPPYNTIFAIAGMRNETTAFGEPKGTILFAGGDSRRVGINKYTIDYTFHYDGWYHLRQIPDRTADGIVPTTADGDGVMRATQVHWVQPYVEFGNFYSLDIPW
jgi:hypothetical protein